MSSTNRGAQRITNDHYRTPRSAWEPLYDRIKWVRVDDITDPCAGDGRLLEPVMTYCLTPHGTEIDANPPYPTHWPVRYGVDYLAPHEPYGRCLGVTNPPFSRADEIVMRMLRDFKSVIVLQRVNWLGGQHRAPFWREALPILTHMLVLPTRPSFVAKCRACDNQQHLSESRICAACGDVMRKGPDSTEYAWFCWDRAKVLDVEPFISRIESDA